MISNYCEMRPFFMSIVSDADHWMFIASNGGLSAGRQNSDHAIFPYYSDDKITDFAELTGSKTIIHLQLESKWYLWEPFSSKYQGIYAITRNLYKNYCGNKILFEEINDDLGVTFRYSWNLSDQYGFVKKSEIRNHNDSPIAVSVLDGIQNILPAGVGDYLQQVRSNLVDAYKKNELDRDTGLGIFSLSAVIVDRPVPSESLSSTLSYSVGTKDTSRLLSSVQLDQFRMTGSIIMETDIRAERGAYFVKIGEEINSRQSREWMIVADNNKNLAEISFINRQLKDHDKLKKAIEDDIDKGTQNLMNLVANADGLQACHKIIDSNRHFANVLFNIMRGGIPDHGYYIPIHDFTNYLALFNKPLYETHRSKINQLQGQSSYADLVRWAGRSGDEDLERLSREYLPLIFSRRHGDPSRPWNKFSINLRGSKGEKVYSYEGNWRDIFQNWEALALSYPHFISGMITKFVNASTLDGYNPYRITKEGIDWEVIEPDDPWSFIGYWGDHQVIYLQKLLEISFDHFPNEIPDLLERKIFSYANVPYRIKPYHEIVYNARDTIYFDQEAEEEIKVRVKEIGSDGKLKLDKSGSVFQVNLMEKLLVMILTKFSNFIPEAGIWLNTQRPEWNDANNALVGNGVSMVTLCYMYRFQQFIDRILTVSTANTFEVSAPLKDFLEAVTTTLQNHKFSLDDEMTDEIRRSITDALGLAGEDYRLSVYSERHLVEPQSVSKDDIQKFISISIKYLAHTIASNKRPDNLYHAYNLIDLSQPGKATIRRLYEMLEGQVSILSAGILNAREALEVLDALKGSALFREDQHSYILYPDRDLPRFQEKNIIPQESVQNSKLLQRLIADGNKDIVYTDPEGGCHFNVAFNNNENLKIALENLRGTQYDDLVVAEEDLILTIYEDLFDHSSFTGRSGTFFGYEGLGSIYWHMVSKLRLAVFENCLWAQEQGADAETLRRLKDHYYDVERGLGNNKTPAEYGAFPMDPYSHTPAHKGAQQPGMTGQVKEDIIARFGELGVRVRNGCISFSPYLLRNEEFLAEEYFFQYYDTEGQDKSISLKAGSLAFTYCKILIIYQFADRGQTQVYFEDSRIETIDGFTLPHDISRQVFDREGQVDKIVVTFKR